MSRKSIILFLAGIVAVVAASAIGISLLRKSSISASLYYLSPSGEELIEKDKSITYSKTEEIPLDVINALKSRSGFSAVSPIPKNAKVNTVAYEGGGKLRVDFSGEFVTESSSPVLSAYAVIKSICSASGLFGVTEVKVTCDGAGIKTRDGIEIEYLSGEKIGIEGDIMSLNTECVLYYIDKNTRQLRGEKRVISSGGGESIESRIIEALVEGPVSRELEKVLGGGVRFISAETVNGICYVNFESFEDETENSDGVYSVVKSLTSIEKNNAVKFLINGQSVGKIGNSDTSEPINRE